MVTHQSRTLKVVSRREVIIIALDVVFMQAMYLSWTRPHFQMQVCIIEGSPRPCIKGSPGQEELCQKKSKPFSNLEKQDVVRELGSRGIFQGDTKKELEDNLTNELQGV